MLSANCKLRELKEEQIEDFAVHMTHSMMFRPSESNLQPDIFAAPALVCPGLYCLSCNCMSFAFLALYRELTQRTAVGSVVQLVLY